MDLYWGGPERRITGLTVRIIAVNAVALLFLLLGVLYVGQYQTSLIEAKLEAFGAEVELVAAAIAEGTISSYEKPSISPFAEPEIITNLNPAQARRMVRRLSSKMQQRIYVFDNEGHLVADSHNLVGEDGTIEIAPLEPIEETYYQATVLKNMIRFIMDLMPDRKVLPTYPETRSKNIQKYPDAYKAIKGGISISAWNDKNKDIFLSAAAPLTLGESIFGVVLLTKKGSDIEADIDEVWFNILKTFAVTLIVTILLSIYLSGVIARPLKKLANAADSVRKGKASFDQIPDLSGRHDEIGDLSVVLRDMTRALSERMDTIERFAADVSHELKNPLTSLRSAVETANIVKKPKDREKLMGIIMHDVERLDRLISDISNASRLDTELSREQFERINLRIVLNNLIDMYKNPLDRKQIGQDDNWQNEVEHKGIKIILNAHSNTDIFVWGLEGRITQIFENLLSNAISFSPEGSIIEITVTPLRNRVTITMEDQGPGIPENKIETIFERFYSERPEHEAYGAHSGLGLSICRQIMEAMGGQISASNIIGPTGEVTGACFTVILNTV